MRSRSDSAFECHADVVKCAAVRRRTQLRKAVEIVVVVQWLVFTLWNGQVNGNPLYPWVTADV